MLTYWIVLLVISLVRPARPTFSGSKKPCRGDIMKIGQIIANVILYGFLVWLLYDSLIAEWDPFFAFVVGFVMMWPSLCS